MNFFRLTNEQVRKISGMSADSGQVFLASVVLPSLGFGGNISISGIILGIFLTMVAFAFSLYLVQYSTI